MTRVAIVPLGDVAQEDLQTASDALEHVYGVNATVLGARPLPGVGDDAERDQYDVTALLEVALDDTEHAAEAVLGITNAEVSSRHRVLVSGSGSPDGGRAVLSTHRFGDSDYKRRSRIRRQAIKQVGHALGLDRCDGNCVMRSSSTVGELDRYPDRLCRTCHSALPRELTGDSEPVGGLSSPSTPTFAEWRRGVRDVVLAPLLWVYGARRWLPFAGRRLDSDSASVTPVEWAVAVVGLLLTPLFWLLGAVIRTPPSPGDPNSTSRSGDERTSSPRWRKRAP
ncbi:archaemetzincin [Halogranum rubrum]|uniref:Uncharacterized protein n=1 Tax=Halogranum salarium B-1 TaxID=1210908 RepID=J3EZX1_9EURY|nr:archaemetzincin [Halogranum salarium]EJN61227.1 hypothetical protein HSB1_02680 [Halogranum salarium B-1]